MNNGVYAMIQWKDLVTPMTFVGLSDFQGTLRIFLKDKLNRKGYLKFDGYLTFRKMNEGDAIRSLDLMKKKSLLSNSVIFYKKSKFLSWFLSESCGIYSTDKLSHCRILFDDDIIDVISILDEGDKKDSTIIFVETEGVGFGVAEDWL